MKTLRILKNLSRLSRKGKLPDLMKNRSSRSDAKLAESTLKSGLMKANTHLVFAFLYEENHAMVGRMKKDLCRWCKHAGICGCCFENFRNNATVRQKKIFPVLGLENVMAEKIIKAMKKSIKVEVTEGKEKFDMLSFFSHLGLLAGWQSIRKSGRIYGSWILWQLKNE